jgi:hypothetical protein
MKKYIIVSIVLTLATAFANAQLNTTGYQSWKPLYNSMLTWDDGAFNMNQTGHPDYGWGLYNSITHGLSGDSIYLIKLQDGSFKQLFIEDKNSMGNIYNFRYADVTGANEVIEQALCVNYTDKLFLYYSLQNQAFVDRDPVNSAWDMVLTKFTDTAINYTVTGFLLNEGSKVSVYHAPDATTAMNSGLADTTTFKNDITTIGNSWNKVVGFSIIPLDTMVYFVKNAAKDIYKLQFTFFESGSSMGTGKGRVGIQSRKLYPTEEAIVKDTLVMGNGYLNDVYYSMVQGITKESPRASWDIAFKTNAYSASIITNSTMGIALYTYPKSYGEGISAWQSLATPLTKTEKTSVFPNPAKDFVNFVDKSWEQNSEIKLMVYNSAGQLVLSQAQTLNGSGFRSNLGTLSEGLYHARILNNGRYSSAKILVSR